MIAVRVIRKNGELRRGRAPWLDADEDFLLVAPYQQDGTLFFLAHGGTRGGTSADTITIQYIDEEGTALGFSTFVGLPRQHRGWKRFEIFRPTVHLAMRVGRADGGLEGADVRALQQALEPQTEEDREVLRSMMKEAPLGDVEALAYSMAARLPGSGPADLLTLLLTMAYADGAVEPEELEIIAEAARVIGVSEDEWRQGANAMGIPLPGGIGDIAEALRFLGLKQGATAAQAKRAYRRNMREHHPDRVTHKGPRAVHRATERTKRIKHAYELLLSSNALGPESRRGAHTTTANTTTSQRATRPRPPPPPRRQANTHTSGAHSTRSRSSAPPPQKQPPKQEPPKRHPEPPPVAHPSDATGLDDDDELDRRKGHAVMGAFVGGMLALPAGGIGAIPGAMIGALIGYYLKEVATVCTVLVLVLFCFMLCLGAML
jgi:DnaJ like chaperone protein